MLTRIVYWRLPWLILLAGMVSGPTGGTEPLIAFEPYIYETHDGRRAEAELGRFRVPLNRGTEESGELVLALVRFPALADEPGPPVVYLAGGPGGSGIQAGRGARFDLFQRLRRESDVILLDQRGTGRSQGPEPEECPVERRYPSASPFELEPFLEMVEAVAGECRRFWADHGVDLDGYDAVESAEDIETLRRALSAPRINLLGISYGTHLALSYLRNHPDRVHRAVLAGVEGPDHTVKLPAQFDRQLDQLERLLEEQKPPDWEAGGLRDLVAEVLDNVEERPVRLHITEVEGPDRVHELVVSRRELAQVTMDMLQDPVTMVRVPYLYRQLASGDFTDVAGALEGLREIGGLEAMPEAVDAASGISEERRRLLLEQDDSLLLGSGFLRANLAVIRGLGVPDLGEGFREPIASDVPTLFISGSLDGRTPPANAKDVARGFNNASHLTVVNGGHGNDLLVTDSAVPKAIVSFFAGENTVESVEMLAPDISSVRQRISLSPVDASRYVGEYQRPSGEIWRVFHRKTVSSLDADGDVLLSNAVLQIRWGGDGFPFHPVSVTQFFIDFRWYLDLAFRFELAESGTVESLVLENASGDTVRMKKVY